MQIGTLVVHEKHPDGGMGIVIEDMKIEDRQHSMVTVHWLDGMGVGLYWTDELEVLDKNELFS